MKFSHFVLASLVLCLGCGAPAQRSESAADVAGNEPPNDADAASADGGSADGGSIEGEGTEFFKGLSFGERKAFMNDVVVPEMKPLFIEKHPDFSCISCHGDDMTSKNYEMPNTLAPLNPAAMPFESADPRLRAAAEFMKEKVVPQMAGLLKEPAYNPETKSGFGCFDCHATAQ